MSEPNTAGHLGATNNNPAPIPGTAGSTFTVPVNTYFEVYESSPGIFKPTDGTEAAINACAGVVGPGIYTASVTAVSVLPPGSELPPIAPNFIGEAYASKTGALVSTLAASVDLASVTPATSWGQKVGKSLAEKYLVLEAVVEQRVA